MTPTKPTKLNPVKVKARLAIKQREKTVTVHVHTDLVRQNRTVPIG